MKLLLEPFKKMQSGQKTIEIRLYDEKRQQIQIVDTIEFSQLPNLNEKLTVEVVGLLKYKSFRALIENHGMESFGYPKDYSQDEFIKSIYTIYSKEEEEKYGVLGIQVKVFHENIMKAFIELDAGTDQRPIYNEDTLEYIKTKTVYKPYPYAYGFLLDTISGDGERLDCYVITSKSLTSGSTIDVEPIGMVESIENGEEDHKILCCLPGEKVTVDTTIEHNIREFGEHYFDDRPDKQVIIGKFLGYDEAIKLIEACKIPS